MGLKNAFVSRINNDLLGEYGGVFYSGDQAFSAPSPIYILGVNPGGIPKNTIEQHLTDGFPCDAWSSYVDEAWYWQGKQRPAGQSPFQQRIRHLVGGLNLDIRNTPASNLIFVTTPSEAELKDRFVELADRCWPFHEAVIVELEVRVVICLTSKVRSYVTKRLGAHQLRETFVENNLRRCKSTWHSNGKGLNVVTLNHPSRFDWTSPNSDPTSLVRKALDSGSQS